ncbi:hypothetical protein [Oceanivirga salmonicida]|uniref:hypothetical protein n=1 Tax=Oceanivirga salmonicida TaxID=1769291 RepID=UPI00082B4A74|nr:hypothetical protein [Oceanivirga salmonicida]
MRKKVIFMFIISAISSFSIKLTSELSTTKYDFVNSTKYLTPDLKISVSDIKLTDGLELNSKLELLNKKVKNKPLTFEYNIGKFLIEAKYKKSFRNYYKHTYGIESGLELDNFKKSIGEKLDFNHGLMYKVEKGNDWNVETNFKINHGGKVKIDKDGKDGINLDIGIKGRYKINDNFSIYPSNETYLIVDSSKSKGGKHSSISSSKFDENHVGIVNDATFKFKYKKNKLEIEPEFFTSYKSNGLNKPKHQMSIGNNTKFTYETYFGEAGIQSLKLTPSILVFVNTGFRSKDNKLDLESKIDLKLGTVFEQNYKITHKPFAQLTMKIENEKDYSVSKSGKITEKYDKKMKLELKLKNSFEYIYNKIVKFIPSIEANIDFENLILEPKPKVTSETKFKFLTEINEEYRYNIKPSILFGIKVQKDFNSSKKQKKLSYYLNPVLETEFDLTNYLKLSWDTGVKIEFENNAFKKAPLSLKLKLEYKY